jgi:hypothetical protein
MFRKTLALVLVVALTGTGCASASTRGPMSTPVVVQSTAMADYIQRIPVGSRVRLERTDGQVLHGTLMQASAAGVTIQKNTRIPEPPIEIPVASIARMTLDQRGGTSPAKAIAIGVASGVGAFLVILGIIAATFDD